MTTVNMHEAKSRLSRLVEEALAGGEIIIARAGKPAVRLVPVQRVRQVRKPGRLKGKIQIASDFAETPDDVINAFEN